MKVKITVLVSFNDHHAGDTTVVDDSPLVRGWESAGLMRVEAQHYGASEAGPSGAEPDDTVRKPSRAPRKRKASTEPGAGFGSGGYGAAEGIGEAGGE